MRRLFGVFLFIIIVSAFPLAAQPVAGDSLLRVLSETREPRARAELLAALAFEYYDVDAEQGYRYASDAYAVARKAGYTAGICEALTLQGYYFYTTGDFTRALELYYRSMAVAGHPPAQKGYTFVMTANAYRSQARYDSAETYYRRASSCSLR